MEGMVEFWGVPNWAPRPPMWCHSGAFTAADSFQSEHWLLFAGGPKRESGDTHTLTKLTAMLCGPRGPLLVGRLREMKSAPFVGFWHLVS